MLTKQFAVAVQNLISNVEIAGVITQTVAQFMTGQYLSK